MVSSAVLISTPAFFLGLLALLVLGLWWRIAPIAGIGSGFLDGLAHLWLPAVVICASLVPVMARVLRSSIMATMREEFVEVRSSAASINGSSSRGTSSRVPRSHRQSTC